MRQLRDDRLYDQRQLRVAEEIVLAVKTALTSANIPDQTSKALTEEIAFSLAAILDGSCYMPTEDEYLVPVLGFAEGRLRDRLLVPREGGSSIHGLIPGCVELAFEPQEQERMGPGQH